MHLINLDRRLDNNNPMSVLKHKMEQIDSYRQTLNRQIAVILTNKKHHFDLLRNKLELVNPLKIMDKGYSISSVNEKIITDVKDVNIGDVLTTKMKNGSIVSKVIEVNENGK